MFELFTSRARKVIQYAKIEAQNNGDDCVCIPHILIGLVKEGVGVVHYILENNGISVKMIRDEYVKIVQEGSKTVKEPVFSPETKKLFETAIKEASELKHNYVGTEHLLLALLNDNESDAEHILVNLGFTPKILREETLNLIGFYRNKFLLRPTEKENTYIIVTEEDEIIGGFYGDTQELHLPRPVTIDEVQTIIRMIYDKK